jgi:4-carboxymuconolactone decarboxylase
LLRQINDMGISPALVDATTEGRRTGKAPSRAARRPHWTGAFAPLMMAARLLRVRPALPTSQSRTRTVDVMARISLIEEEDHPELAPLIARIKAGRRGGLLNVYKLLLHSPPLAETWLEYVGAVRWKTTLSGRLRELVVLRVANLNRIEYVLKQHVPALALADGVTLAECDALADWRPSSFFDAAERAALAYADALVLQTSVPDEVFEDLRRHYDERAIVELTVLTGTYLMHNRVMQALKIDLEAPEDRGR